MAIAAVHRKKADLCWGLAQKLYDEKRDEFLCMNMIFNTALHLIEEALAERDKHPLPSHGACRTPTETRSCASIWSIRRC